jgi:hypothetical protein
MTVPNTRPSVRRAPAGRGDIAAQPVVAQPVIAAFCLAYGRLAPSSVRHAP